MTRTLEFESVCSWTLNQARFSAKEVGAERIELYTEPHAAFDNSDVETIFQQYALLLKRLKFGLG